MSLFRCACEPGFSGTTCRTTNNGTANFIFSSKNYLTDYLQLVVD